MKHANRNRAIRTIQIRHDYIMLSYVLFPLTVESLPAGYALIGMVLVLLYLTDRAKEKSSPINDMLLNEIKSTIPVPRIVHFSKAPPNKDVSRALSLGLATIIYLESRIHKKEILDDYARAVIRHELAHAKRNDTFVSFLYEKGVFFLLLLLASVPLMSFLSPYILDTQIPLSFVIINTLINGPILIYLYLTRKQYDYRREFMADAEAHTNDPAIFESFLRDEATKEPFREKKEKSLRGTEEVFHPPFKERYDYICGEIQTPSSQVFIFCFVVGLFSFYALFSLAKGLTVDPEIASGFSALLPIIISIFLAIMYLYHLVQITRVVCNVRNSDLTRYDKFIGTIGLMVGFLPIPIYFAAQFHLIDLQFTLPGILSVLALCWILGIFPIITIICTSIFFKQIRHIIPVVLICIFVDYHIFNILQVRITDSGFVGLSFLKTIAMLLIFSLAGPIIELLCRIPRFVFATISRLLKLRCRR